MADEGQYFLRGVKPVATESSRLVSSSKFLNDVRLRDCLSLIALRKNGPDLPSPAELVELIPILDGLRDFDRIEWLFTEERKINPRLDAWFAEEYRSPPMTIDDYAPFAAGTLGGILHQQFVDKFEVQISPHQWDTTKTQYEYYQRRELQMHDLEHIIVGGTVDALGELPPSWFRMTNVPKYIRNAELVGELMHYKMFASLRFTSRTILHYPEVWWHCTDAIHRGMVAGWASEPLFMQKLEPVLGLPLEEARAALGVRGVVDRDTGAASAFWLGEGPPPSRPDEVAIDALAAE